MNKGVVLQGKLTEEYFVNIVFSVALISSIFQFYFLKISGSFFSLTVLTTLFLLPEVIRRALLLTWRPLFALSILAIIEISSYFWSNDMKLGLRNLLDLIIFITIVVVTYGQTSKNPRRLLKIFEVYFILLIIPALLVIIFRINQSLEVIFLHSTISEIFINPNVVDGLFNGARNNIFDPAKSGGFFVNANVAAAFLGINAILAYAFSKAYNIKWLRYLSAFLAFSVLFTGSKAGLILIVVIPIGLYTFNRFNNSMSLKWILIFNFFLLLFWFFILIGVNYYEKILFLKKVMETTSIREIIWGFAWQEFLQHPFLGLGFGGWQQLFKSYAESIGIQTGFPPHNTLIYLWAQSGIAALIVGSWFMLEILRYSFSLLLSKFRELNALGTGLLGAFSWVFLHGMGTNFGLVGELHMETILAAALGFSLARIKTYQCIVSEKSFEG